ncbi:MAG: hypothetical protein ACE5GO_01985 [Anaerolineales bacterium]
MSGNPYANLDEYGLRHMAGHLYRLGPDYYPRLYKLATAGGWHQTQRAFDPSRQTYAESLNWALRAAEADRDSLPALLVLSLLRATVSSLAANIPPTALQALSLLGDFRQARAYTEVQTDALSKCEALSRLATTAWQSGDLPGAQKSLEQAAAVAHTIRDKRTRTHALGLIAAAAGQAGIQERYADAFQQIQSILSAETWAISRTAREYQLLDQPEYVLALVEWDRVERWHPASLAAWGKRETLPAIARAACKKGDRALLNTILSEAKRNPFSGDPLIEALTEAGCTADGLNLINEWYHQTGDVLAYREAMARAAGRQGDLATIERAASYSPSQERRKSTRAYAVLDWDERVEDWKDRLAESLEKTMKGMRGRLLGTDWERLQVLLAGVEGLAENHPEQARVLWTRLQQQGNRLARRLVQELGAFVPGISGEPAPPSKLLTRLMDISAKLASRNPNTRERAETQSLLAEVKANLGEMSQALEHVRKIEDLKERDHALAAMVDTLRRSGQIDQALDFTARISQSEKRKSTLDRIAQSLLELPLDQVEAPLQRIFSLAEQLPVGEALSNSTAHSALFGSLAEATSAKAAYALSKGPGVKPTLSTWTTLCRLACEQNDLDTAKALVAEAEKTIATPPSKTLTAQEPGGDSTRSHQVASLAEISVQCAQAAAREGGPSRGSLWTAQAGQAFRLAQNQANRLPAPMQPACWPYLARAARYRQDRESLRKLLKQASRLKAQGMIPVDRALVHIAVGLTFTGDYLEAGKDMYPPAVDAIYWNHFKAQALAEMSEVVRAAPPKKTLFGFGKDKEAREIRADALLDQSKRLLGLQVSDLMLSKFNPRLASPSYSRFGPQSRLPPKSGVLQVPAREALSRILDIYARRGLFGEVSRIPSEIASDADRPVVFGKALRALGEAGQMDRARQLLDGARTQGEKTLGALGLAGALAPRDPAQAQKLISQAIPSLWDVPDQGTAFLSCAEAVLKMPIEWRHSYPQELLRTARARGRSDTLSAISSHVRVLISLIDAGQWLETVRKIIEMEDWWLPTQSMI